VGSECQIHSTADSTTKESPALPGFCFLRDTFFRAKILPDENAVRAFSDCDSCEASEFTENESAACRLQMHFQKDCGVITAERPRRLPFSDEHKKTRLRSHLSA
jgi:hypothetical protein